MPAIARIHRQTEKRKEKEKDPAGYEKEQTTSKGIIRRKVKVKESSPMARPMERAGMREKDQLEL